MTTQPELTRERLCELLDYNPETGVFTWRISRGWRKPGTPAGKIQTDGYRQIPIDGRQYLAHRLVWFWHHGKWPDYEIDHTDHNRLNNRIENLRDVERHVNIANRRSYNASGFKGVSRKSKGSGFFARLTRIDGTTDYLGTFRSAEEAHQAFKAAHAEHHGIESEFFDELHVPSPAIVKFAAEVINRVRAQRDAVEVA